MAPRHNVGMSEANTNDLVHQAATLLASDSALQQVAWTGVSLIFRTEPGSDSLSGYLYEADSWSAFFPETAEEELTETLHALRRSSASPGHAPWHACLLRIRRADRKVLLDFEYDDADRWEAGPANYEVMAESVRPPPLG